MPHLSTLSPQTGRHGRHKPYGLKREGAIRKGPIMKKNSKTILITGASSGFGRDMAETLAADAHKVYGGVGDLAGRNSAAAEALRGKGVEVLALDVTSDAEVEDGIKSLLARSGGKLDVVINNAGVFSAGVSESFTTGQLRDLFEVNVIGVQRLMRATLPTLRAQRDGLVVNIGSILGRVTFPFLGLYGARNVVANASTVSASILPWCRT